ncbi:MAG TPA: S1 RNA-binding domain-containing protein, partial [Anaerolineae bacterium]|nr:S1 RNA-binding domain-containing protein [Anaerolineae bacterium]
MKGETWITMVDRMMGEEGTNNNEASGSPMWKFLEEEYDYKRPKRGDIRYAEVLRIDKDEIIVDIGGKTEGVVPSVDLERMGEEAVSQIEVGDKVPVYVLRPESADGDVIVSLNMARTMEDWRRAEKLYESGDVFDGTIAGHNKGGLLVYFGQIRGFVPASQLSGLSRRSSHEERMQTLSKMEGQELLLKVIEVDRQRRRLIFSERAASREYRDKRKTELLDDLQEGDIRTGTVRNLCDFGAFVDLGGADGLIHISELSWRRVRHARDVLRAGQEVEVYVLRIDREKKRIGLSLKRLQPDPWQVVEEKYQVGQIVKGVVTNIVDFGAFARIEDGIEGLIHVSELSDGDFAPQDLVREGEQLYVKILSIDSDRQRMGLSLKQGPTREEMEGEEAWAGIQEEREVAHQEGLEAEARPEVPVSPLDESTVEAEPEVEELEEVEFEAEPVEPVAVVEELEEVEV